MGLEVSSTGQSASFPFGARLSGVRLISTRTASGGLLVESPAVTIAPAFLSMLTMHPGVRVKAALYDGIVNATIRPSGSGTAISYALDSLDLARQHLWTIPGASVVGNLSGSGKSAAWRYRRVRRRRIERRRTDVHLGTREFANPSGRRPFKIQIGSGHPDDRTTNNHRRRRDADRRRNDPVRTRPRRKRTSDPVHPVDSSRRRLAVGSPVRNPTASPRPAALSPDRHPQQLRESADTLTQART